MVFKGPEGSLNQLQKAAAFEKAHCIFNGVVKVPRLAQRTKANQLSRNLILSKRARIDTKPQLEIVADDVTCTHGATITQLQDDELFYLRSRGIDFKEATSLILRGYCQEIISELPERVNHKEVLNEVLK